MTNTILNSTLIFNWETKSYLTNFLLNFLIKLKKQLPNGAIIYSSSSPPVSNWLCAEAEHVIVMSKPSFHFIEAVLVSTRDWLMQAYAIHQSCRSTVHTAYQAWWVSSIINVVLQFWILLLGSRHLIFKTCSN